MSTETQILREWLHSGRPPDQRVPKVEARQSEYRALERGLAVWGETNRLCEGRFVRLGDLDSGYAVSYLFSEVEKRASTLHTTNLQLETDSYTVVSSGDEEPAISVNAPATRPPVQLSAVATFRPESAFSATTRAASFAISSASR